MGRFTIQSKGGYRNVAHEKGTSATKGSTRNCVVRRPHTRNRSMRAQGVGLRPARASPTSRPAATRA